MDFKAKKANFNSRLIKKLPGDFCALAPFTFKKAAGFLIPFKEEFSELLISPINTFSSSFPPLKT